MKILHTVEFYSPSVGGAQEVVKQLSEHLVTLGHDVYVATTKLSNRTTKSINGVKIVEFEVCGNAVRGYKGRDIEKYKQYLVKSNFDVVMNYAAQQWTTDLTFEVIDSIRAKKVLVPCGFSGLYDPAYQSYFSKLPATLRKYDHTIYLSHNYRDIMFARKHKIHNTIVVPNGADEREFTATNSLHITDFKRKLDIKDKLIITVGNHTNLKGHIESIKTILNSGLKNTTLMIIGDVNLNGGCYKKCSQISWLYNNIMSRLLTNGNQIKVVNLSREDTIVAFRAADLFLFLSNIECSPLVLFEAAASGTPFVASNAGNSKEIAKWTGCGLIANSKTDKYGYTSTDIASATKLVRRLLDDSKLYEKMSKSGRDAWKRKFTWAKIAKEYEKLYEES